MITEGCGVMAAGNSSCNHILQYKYYNIIIFYSIWDFTVFLIKYIQPDQTFDQIHSDEHKKLLSKTFEW